MEDKLFCRGNFSAPLKKAVNELKEFNDKLIDSRGQYCVMDVHTSDGEDIAFSILSLDAIERVVEKICEIQITYKLRDSWSLCWAETSHETHCQSGSGGAVVCYRGNTQWLSMPDWISYATKNLKMQYQ